MISIRREQKEDFPDVYRINSIAFQNDGEAKLVELLRDSKTYIGLVAELDGRVVGHISFSAVTLNDEPAAFLGLAPMSVLPEFQNQGIGSFLVTEGLAAAAVEGFTAVFVLGHPEYYPRFGFTTAKLNGFACEYPAPDEAFMALELVPGALAGKQGLIKYGPEFAAF